MIALTLLACASTTPTVAAPAAAPAADPSPARRYTAGDIAGVAEELEALATGTPVQVFARDSDSDDGAWRTLSSLHDLPDALSVPGAEYPVESADFFALFTLGSGERLVQTGTIAQGDGLTEASYLFSPRGRLLRFTRTEGSFGDMCGEQIAHLIIDYPLGEPAQRDYTFTLNNGEPVPPEYGCQRELDYARSATDPGWGPRWLLQDELPVDLRPAG